MTVWNPRHQTMFEDDDVECKSYDASQLDSSNHDSNRTSVYTPTFLDNTPAVLTFDGISVTTKGENKKSILKNISGSITGGFWAIMGKYHISFNSFT